MMPVNWKPDRTQLASFGAVCALVGVALGAWVTFRHSILGIALSPGTAQTTAHALWIVAAACLALRWLAPSALWPLYCGLMALSVPIGFVVSHLMMALLFYGILTPIGFVFRLIGRDPMTRKFDQRAMSYWVAREPVVDVKRYYRQF